MGLQRSAAIVSRLVQCPIDVGGDGDRRGSSGLLAGAMARGSRPPLLAATNEPARPRPRRTGSCCSTPSLPRWPRGLEPERLASVRTRSGPAPASGPCATAFRVAAALAPPHGDCRGSPTTIAESANGSAAHCSAPRRSTGPCRAYPAAPVAPIAAHPGSEATRKVVRSRRTSGIPALRRRCSCADEPSFFARADLPPPGRRRGGQPEASTAMVEVQPPTRPVLG